MTLAPVRLSEAADSLVKASTPQPFSTSKTSNWIARLGGLPPYIQHLAHGIVRSGKTESKAIEIAVGLVHHPPTSWDANAKAACAKAAAQWEALKAKQHAKSGAKSAVSEAWMASVDRARPTSADAQLVVQGAAARLIEYHEMLGEAGMISLLTERLVEAAQAWQPTSKPTMKADGELERHAIYDGSQHVGTIARRRGFGGINSAPGPDRWTARAVNGSRVGGHEMRSRQEATSAIEQHLASAPARVISLPTSGQYLVATPSEYSETSYRAYPSEGAARHAAGLPAMPTVPEINSKTEAVAEALRFDLMSVSGTDIGPLRRVQEARRLGPFDLIEAFHADEHRDFHGRWSGGGLHPTSVIPTSTRLRGMKPDATRRYEGGVRRMSPETRTKLANVFTPAERDARKAPQPHSEVDKLYELGGKHQPTFEKILHGVQARAGGRRQSTATAADFEKAKGDVRAHPDKPHVIIAAQKGRKRATEKVENKYDGDARRLTDLVRGTVLVPHVDDLPKAIEHIRAELPKGWTITHPENRYVHGRRDDKVNTGTKDGYRDIAVLLRAPDGFQAELQINTTHMWIAKEAGGGHALYEGTRKAREAAAHEKRDLTASERALVTRSDRAARELYNGALTRATRARGKGAAHGPADAAAALRRGYPASVSPRDAPKLIDHLDGAPSALHKLSVEGHPNLFSAHARELSRAQMPQIPKEHLPGFMDFLHAKGVGASLEKVAPTRLQATQNQVDGGSVAKFAKHWDPARAGTMMISRESHVLDGHHRWAASAFHELGHPGYKVDVLRFGASTDRILALMHEYNAQVGVKRRGFGEQRAAA